MTLPFLIFAGLSLLLALALLLWPLLRKPGDSQLESKAEALRRRLHTLKAAHSDGLVDERAFEARRKLLSDELLALIDNPEAAPARSPAAKICAGMLALLVPPLALWMYLQVGEPRAQSFSADARPPSAATAAGSPTEPDEQAPDLAAAAEQLHERLQADPEDIEGWLLLARTYRELANFAGARDAYKRVLDARPDDIDVSVEYAESLGLSSSPRSLLGEPARILDQALARDPQHQRALWLNGFAKTQAGEYQQALDLWEPLLAMMDDPAAQDALLGQVNIARANLGLSALDAPAPAAGGDAMAAAPGAAAAPTGSAATSPSAAIGAGAIEVQISLDPKLSGKLQPSDTLFVFAKAESGPPMPLAVQRIAASELPITLRLDDSMGMVEGMVLSSFPRIQVEARVSKAGNAQAQAGDLQGSSGGLDNPPGQAVKIVIDRVL